MQRKNIDVMIGQLLKAQSTLSWADADCILVAPQNAGDLENG